jgi:hypothetical protein
MNVLVMVDVKKDYVNVIQGGQQKIVRFVVAKMDAQVMDCVI